ncbi:hypothetical protein LWI28_003928 [Acer negundo]|uniref:Uncharacterized protein n=1 Tax=Acer negundo TaxID=4023 RepID=A0AAD5P5B7_ACENE|nr:hypothetical protein LWI28_003928 [Acer negundo]
MVPPSPPQSLRHHATIATRAITAGSAPRRPRPLLHGLHDSMWRPHLGDLHGDCPDLQFLSLHAPVRPCDILLVDEKAEIKRPQQGSGNSPSLELTEFPSEDELVNS